MTTLRDAASQRIAGGTQAAAAAGGAAAWSAGLPVRRGDVHGTRY